MKQSNSILNKLWITLPALSQNESACRAMVGAFLAQLNPSIDELADMKCVVSEAVTNSIVHAYPDATADAPGMIYIQVTLYQSRKVKITVRDRGCGIKDIDMAKTPLFTTDPKGERSGMGFAVMENFTDRLVVSSKVGHGTAVYMYKSLK